MLEKMEIQGVNIVYLFINAIDVEYLFSIRPC